MERKKQLIKISQKMIQKRQRNNGFKIQASSTWPFKEYMQHTSKSLYRPKGPKQFNQKKKCITCYIIFTTWNLKNKHTNRLQREDISYLYQKALDFASTTLRLDNNRAPILTLWGEFFLIWNGKSHFIVQENAYFLHTNKPMFMSCLLIFGSC